jgi:ABC-type glycerol-3-phosphate transport system substrate-binding protein
MMPGGAIDIAPLPRGKFRKGAMVNHMMAISSGSTKKEEAWEFVKFLTSDVAQRMVHEVGANIPASRAVVSSKEFLGAPETHHLTIKVYLDELRYSVGWPFDQGPYLTQHTLQAETDYALRRILLGHANTGQSLKIMQDHVNRIIANERHIPEAEPFLGSVVFYSSSASLLALVTFLWKSRRRKTRHGHESFADHRHIP